MIDSLPEDVLNKLQILSKERAPFMPEIRLLMAIITQSLQDLRNKNVDKRKNALEFLTSNEFIFYFNEIIAANEAYKRKRYNGGF